MNIPKLNFESEAKFALSIGLAFFVIAGVLFAYYIANFQEHLLPGVLITYCILFGVGGLLIFRAGIIQFLKDESDKKNFLNLRKKEKEIEVKHKQILLDEKIKELSEKDKGDKRIELLKEQKELYNQEQTAFNQLSPGSAVGTAAITSMSLPSNMTCTICGGLMIKGKDGFYCSRCGANESSHYTGPLDFIR